MTGTVEQGSKEFVRARGSRSPWSFSSAADLAPEQVPCVLLGSERQAVLVTGLSTAPGARWMTIGVPATLQPVRRSLEEVEEDAVAAFKARHPGQPSGIESLPCFQDPENRMRLEEFLRQRSAEKREETIAEDAKTERASLAGTHVARLDLFANWIAVQLDRREGK